MAKKKDDTETKEAPTTAMTVLSKSGYALAKYDAAQLVETVRENFGGDDLTPNDLDRVKMPSGGGIAWEVPGLDGELSPVKELTGVIVLYRPARAYWAQSLEESGGGSPPDCSAADGKRGEGQPGGVCADCPLNVFGSSEKGRGKACKEMRLLFIVRPESLLPLVVPLPPTSIKPFKQYLQRLTSAALPYPRVQTKITLTKEKNADNIEFAQASFKMVDKLDDASAAHIKAYAESMRAAFEGVQVTQDDAV
jgi:hypothetical protein